MNFIDNHNVGVQGCCSRRKKNKNTEQRSAEGVGQKKKMAHPKVCAYKKYEIRV